MSEPMMAITPARRRPLHILARDLRRNGALYILVLPVLAYYAVFCYKPMFGIIIAFKDYKPALGIFGSPWIGLLHFADFFSSMHFARLIRNTLLISIYSLLWSFPAPIILSLLLNEIKNQAFKRTIQTISYFPHFISTVVICGLLTEFSLSNGLFNHVRAAFGLARTPLLQEPAYFRTLYIASGIWQSVGWNTIIYLAAISGIDPQLYEAAALDGAGRWARARHVTLPGIKDTTVILLILSIGGLMNVGSEKIILLYNPSIYDTADVLSTYVYRKGLQEFNYSFSSAVGLFNSVINFLLVLMANGISRKVSESSLF